MNAELAAAGEVFRFQVVGRTGNHSHNMGLSNWLEPDLVAQMPVGCVGPILSTAGPIKQVHALLDIPVVGLATLSLLSDRTTFPFFVRVMPSDEWQAQFVYEAIVDQHPGSTSWVPVCIIWATDVEVSLQLRKEFVKHFLDGDAYLDIPIEDAKWDAEHIIDKLMGRECKTIFYTPMWGARGLNFWEVPTLLDEALSRGFLHGYNWILPEAGMHAVQYLHPTRHMGILLSMPGLQRSQGGHEMVYAFIMDAMQIWKRAVLFFESTRKNIFAGDQLMELISSMSFLGSTGVVQFWPNSTDRKPEYQLLNYVPSGVLQPVLTKRQQHTTQQTKQTARAVYWEMHRPIIFPGNFSTFSPKPTLELKWLVLPAEISENAGLMMTPCPVVLVTQQGAPIRYPVKLVTNFYPTNPDTQPTPPNVVFQGNGAFFLYDLVFLGVRGTNYTMSVSVVNHTMASGPLTAPVHVPYCPVGQHVHNLTNCKDCPPGFVLWWSGGHGGPTGLLAVWAVCDFRSGQVSAGVEWASGLHIHPQSE